MPTPPVYAVLYRSIATYPMGELEIRALTVRSGQRNVARDITGLFLYGTLEHLPGIPGSFVQWLEGPEAEVRALFGRIAEDQRHSDEEVLAQGPIHTIIGEPGRLFPDWSMETEGIGNTPASLQGFLAYVRRQRREGGERWARAA